MSLLQIVIRARKGIRQTVGVGEDSGRVPLDWKVRGKGKEEVAMNKSGAPTSRPREQQVRWLRG